MKDSRIFNAPEILNQQQLEQYWSDGYLVVRNVFQAESVARWVKESQRLWNELDINSETSRVQGRQDIFGHRVTDRIDPVLDISPEFQQLADAQFIRSVLSDLLSADVQIFKGKLISKWPNTCGYELHQDYSYWIKTGEVAADDLITALIPFNAFTLESGGLEVLPAMHNQVWSRVSPDSLDMDENTANIDVEHLVALEPGDLLLFHSLTPHKSGANRSQNNREALFITYVKQGYGDVGADYYLSRQDNWLNDD